MTKDFSFGKLMRHLEAGTSPIKATGFPAQEHMSQVMQAYVARLTTPDPEFEAKHFAGTVTGEDPVGSRTSDASNAQQSFAQAVERLVDVAFTIKKAEMVSPVSFSVENKAAMAFKVWAEVDGRNISIDIIDVMTFDSAGKICDIRAYWGPQNVTVLD